MASGPGKYDLSIYRGDSRTWSFTLWKDDKMTQPFDLAGYTVAAEIRDRSGGTVSTTLACAIVQPNIVNVTLSPTASAAAVSGNWDLQLTKGTDIVQTVIAGRAQVTDDITGSTR